MVPARWLDFGEMDYLRAWEEQLILHEQVLAGAPDTLMLVQHPAVLTLGASFHEQNLLLSREQYGARGIALEHTDRGGDVTYHGPGQLVIYPIFDLRRHGRDLHLWMRSLEETMMRVLESYSLQGRRFPPHTGAWVGDRKIAAIGVKVRRWVNLHGIALNCNTDLDVFSLIVPCGIEGFGVTSLTQELGRVVRPEDARAAVLSGFAEVYGLEWAE